MARHSTLHAVISSKTDVADSKVTEYDGGWIFRPNPSLSEPVKDMMMGAVRLAEFAGAQPQIIVASDRWTVLAYYWGPVSVESD